MAYEHTPYIIADLFPNMRYSSSSLPLLLLLWSSPLTDLYLQFASFGGKHIKEHFPDIALVWQPASQANSSFQDAAGIKLQDEQDQDDSQEMAKFPEGGTFTQ